VIRRGWLLGLALAACSSGGSDASQSQPPPTAPAVTARVAAPPAVPPGAPPAVPPDRDDPYDPGSLGALNFALSEGTPAARSHFTRGLLALHSFWYDKASREFQAAIDADPTMNMAYWGAAMSRCKLLWGDDDLAGARDLLSRMPDPGRLTPREQAWVSAAVELVRAGDVRTSRQRFAAAMTAIHDQFPDDESTTFLAIALLAAMRPGDPDAEAVRKRAGALAASVFAHAPKHPGAAHYVIHAYDTPELAAQALPFARAYAAIAPAAFHARHMPAHIFSRLGMWKDAIASCQSAWDASVASARADQLSANHHDFHSLSWLVEMSFELGQRQAADRALQVFADEVRAGLGHQYRAQYASEVASYLMRTGEWGRLDELLQPLAAPVAEDGGAPPLPPPDAKPEVAPSHCAPAPAAGPIALLEQLTVSATRARAAAMQHDLAKTQRYLGELDAVRAQLRPFMEATQPPAALARIAATDARRRQALLARAAGNDRALVEVLRQSVVEDQESGGESNPSGFVVHEDLADTLLRLGQPAAAAAEYALVLQAHPGRAHALLGAARTAARVGDRKAARRWYEQLVAQWSAADDQTPGLAEARKAVAAPP
jgi:tetratricopeptide (TPR) repeat protein